jgi:hypothetical protein
MDMEERDVARDRGSRDVPSASAAGRVGRRRGVWVAAAVASGIAIVIGVVLLVVLTQRAPASNTSPVVPTPTDSPHPTPTPTRTAAPSPSPSIPDESEAVAEPASRFAFGCDELAADAAAFFDEVPPAVVSTIPQPYGNTVIPGPLQYSFAQAGAIYCEYGDRSGTWVTLAVVPDAHGVFEHQQETAGSCQRDFACELIDGTYVSVQGALASPDDERWRQASVRAYEGIRSRVLDAPPSAPTWPRAEDGTAADASCENVLPARSLSEIYGQEIAWDDGAHWGGWSVEAWMLIDYWNTDSCGFHPAGQESMWAGLGGMTWLPGGEWAYEIAAPSPNVTLADAGAGDRAAWSCGDLMCAVDVLAAGDWVRVRLHGEPGAADVESLATSVAEAVIAAARG